MSKEAMKLRTAAEKVVELCSECPLSLGKWFIDMSEACESLREALAEQPSQRKQVGDSRFESWYSEDFDPKGKGTKQQMREAYEAGINDPVPQPAQQEYASFAEWAHDYVQDNLHKLKPAQQLVDCHATGVCVQSGLRAEQPAHQCRTDGRCQYAIDSGAEGMGHCPKGKCVMPAQYFDEVMYDGSSTAEALKRFQENVRPTSLPDAFEQLMRESDKPTKVPEQIEKYAAALVAGTHEITNLTIRPKRTWVGLTDEEVSNFDVDPVEAKLMIAKLKEKNNG